jgi:hypothetical protein
MAYFAQQGVAPALYHGAVKIPGAFKLGVGPFFIMGPDLLSRLACAEQKNHSRQQNA